MTAQDGRLYVTAATGALSSATAPVGGGVAVLEELLPRLAARGLAITLLRPGAERASRDGAGWRVEELPVASLRAREPEALLALSERAYARFALAWEEALGGFLDGVEPAGATVLANDVSEGPPFAHLAARGFRQVVLYHVVVGAFFARRYLAPWLGPLGSPARAAGAWRAARALGLARALPRLLRLVWEKEEAAARHAHAVVPSRALADELAACYPASAVAERTSVVPWGVLGAPDARTRDGLRAERPRTLAELGIDPGRLVLLTLSRISGEKRIDRLLDALVRLETSDPHAAQRVALVIAGAPAYMDGARTHALLQERATRLRHAIVRFAGYATTERKWRLFAAADLFGSPSAYEAYGLSIAQAFAAGTPCLACDHQGARELVAPGRGWLVPARGDVPRALAGALREALGADLAPRRAAARRWADEHPFERAADTVAALLESRNRS